MELLQQNRQTGKPARDTFRLPFQPDQLNSELRTCNEQHLYRLYRCSSDPDDVMMPMFYNIFMFLLCFHEGQLSQVISNVKSSRIWK